jgi:hypothetical protein
MTTRSLTLVLTAFAGQAVAGVADDRSIAVALRADAAARETLNAGAAGLAVSAATRFNYAINLRDSDTLGDDDTTIGFGFQDVEVRLAGQVTDSITANISFDFGPSDGVDGNSSVNLEDAFADWAVSDALTLRIGQFTPSYSAGASMSEYFMGTTFRSVSEETLGDIAWTQGVEAQFGGDQWSAAVGLSDGPGGWNSTFDSSAESDFALNARFDYFSDTDKARFADRASWRGSTGAWRVGAGVLYAASGDTNPSTTSATDALWYTIDAAYEGDGWSVNAAFFGVSLDPDTGASTDDFGFEIAGGIFFNDQWEGFARWDTLILDDARTGPGVEDTYSFLAGGVHYYLVPESYAARMTLEIGYALEATTGADGALDGLTTPTGLSPLSGILGDAESGEIMLSAMFQVMF